MVMVNVDKQKTRRAMLRTAAGTGLVSLAGCLSDNEAAESETDASTTINDATRKESQTTGGQSQSVVHGAVKGGSTGVLMNVMKDQGFDTEQGVEVEPKYFASPPKVQKQIVLNKDVPTGFMGSIVATRLQAQGKSPRLTGPYMLYHMYVLTKDSKGIQGPSDLKDRKISWASKAADAWLKFVVILNQKTGLTSADLKFVQTAPPTSINLLKKGELDAILLHEPLVTKALAQNDDFNVIFSPREVWRAQNEMPLTTVDLAWDGNWYGDNQETARALAKATKQTQSYIQSNIDSAVDNYTDAFGLETEAQVELAKERLNEIYPIKWSESEFISSGMEIATQAHELGLIDDEPAEKIFNWVI